MAHAITGFPASGALRTCSEFPVGFLAARPADTASLRAAVYILNLCASGSASDCSAQRCWPHRPAYHRLGADRTTSRAMAGGDHRRSGSPIHRQSEASERLGNRVSRTGKRGCRSENGCGSELKRPPKNLRLRLSCCPHEPPRAGERFRALFRGGARMRSLYYSRSLTLSAARLSAFRNFRGADADKIRSSQAYSLSTRDTASKR